MSGSTQAANDTHYLHTDHLGFVETTTDALGKFVNRMSFGVCGERQKSDWKLGNPVESFLTANGYTGHNQLDSHNLIHMGGRVYDPNLGRFLSADIYIQSPYDSQNYNRYSYVGNNPLSYIDPSGYSKSRSFHPSQQDFAHAMQQVVEQVRVEASLREQQLWRFAEAARNSNNQTMFSAMDAQAFVHSLVGQGITGFTYQENGETYKVSIDAAKVETGNVNLTLAAKANDGFGVTKATMDVGVGALFGGAVGFVGGASYYGTSTLLQYSPTARHILVDAPLDFACRLSGCY